MTPPKRRRIVESDDEDETPAQLATKALQKYKKLMDNLPKDSTQGETYLEDLSHAFDMSGVYKCAQRSEDDVICMRKNVDVFWDILKQRLVMDDYFSERPMDYIIMSGFYVDIKFKFDNETSI
jgi:hypothetical protein